MVDQNLNYLSELEDILFIQRIQNGDESAIDALMLRYKPLLMKIIGSEVGTENAEDVFQEICLAVVQRIRNNPQGIRTIDKWLKQVARSKC